MTEPDTAPSLPLLAALRSYWFWSLPMIAYVAIAIIFPKIFDGSLPSRGLFILSGVAHAWPTTRLKAPFSYILVMSLVWFLSAIVIAMIHAVFFT